MVAATLPSGVIWQSQRKLNRRTSSWTYHGDDIPFVPFMSGFKPEAAVADLFRREIQQKDFVEKATIWVEKINGPVLLVSASKDQVWPSTLLAQIAMDRLIDHQFPFQFEHLVLNDDHYMKHEGPVLMERVRQFFLDNLVNSQPSE